MNYYNPYYVYNPSFYDGKMGFSSILNRSLNFNSILNGTQRALNFFNQALPLIKEAAPMFRNARTMFRVMNEFKKIDSPSNNIDSNKSLENHVISDGGPTFFA